MPCLRLDLPQFNNLKPVQQPHHRVSRIKFEPSLGKIGIIGAFVMIVLEQLAHHKEIEGQGVLAMVVIIIVGVAVFVTAPVNNGPMNGSHQVVDRQQQEHPPMRGKQDIKYGIENAKCDAANPVVAYMVHK